MKWLPAIEGTRATLFSNPTMLSYNAFSSLVRFESKIFFFATKNAQAYYNAGALVVNSKVVKS
jgi:hypothetical protein